MRSNLIAYAGDGAEGSVKMIIWPIFIWQILDGAYFQLGYISSLILFSTIAIQFLLGGVIDRSKNKNFWLSYSALSLSLAWIFKAFTSNVFHIFIVSTYYNIARIFARTSLLPSHYDIASSQGHEVDEYNLIREKGMMFGRVVMGLLILLTLNFFPI